MIGKKVTKWLKATRETLSKVAGDQEIQVKLSETETLIKDMDMGQMTMMKSKAMKKGF